MLYTVVTVCRNALKDFEKTVKSVLSQTFTDYEYVVIDGASTDGTAESAAEYKKEFDKKGISCTVVSERDTGIYNAMNKAIDRSNGKWLIFMNAGDIFYNDEVLREMAPYCTDGYDVVYADTVAFEHGMYKIYKASEDITLLRDHWCMGHQSTFTSSEIMKKYHYDENYKICADYDFYLKALDNGAAFRYVNKFVSEINMYGVSISSYNASTTENFRVLLAHGCITEERFEKELAAIEEETLSRKKKAPFRKFIPEFAFRMKRKREGWTAVRP